MDVSPDFYATTGTTLVSVVGALLTIVVIASIASLVTAGIVWAWGEAHGSYQACHRGKNGVLISVGAATVSGAGVAWMNWLLTIGATL
jgi:phosphatidylglycerophosphate synthase